MKTQYPMPPIKGVNHVQYNGDFAPKLGHSPHHRVVSANYGSASQ